MAAPNICLFNKFGYCKFSERCRKHHINEICSNSTCNIFECRQRHPKLCRYFKNYGRCKFYPCAFRHVSEISNDSNDGIKDIKDKIDLLENAVKEKNRQIEEMSCEITKLETKITEKEANNIVQPESIEKIELFQNNVVERFEALEKLMKYFAEQLDKLSEHVNDLAIEFSDDIGNLSTEKDKSLEQTFKNPFLVLKCDICDFVAKSERGLKTHKTRKHYNCNWCDFVCEEESDIKKHKMDEHTLEYSAEILRSYS